MITQLADLQLGIRARSKAEHDAKRQQNLAMGGFRRCRAASRGVSVPRHLADVCVIESAAMGKSRIRCMDCGADTGRRGLAEYPLMLLDSVWLSIVPDGEGVLCRADIERRLGRPLKKADLMLSP